MATVQKEIDKWQPDWVALRILDFARKVHEFGNDDKALAEWTRQMSEDLIFNNTGSEDEFTQNLLAEASDAYAKKSKAGRKGGIAKARKQKQKSQEVAGSGNARNASATGLEEYYDQETDKVSTNNPSGDNTANVPPSHGHEDGTIDNPSTDGDIREDSQNVHDGRNAGNMESGTSAAGDSFGEARESQNPGEGRKTRTAGISQPAVRPPPSRDRCTKIPIPPRNSEDVRLFALDKKLDVDDARMWYQMNFIDRPGCDKDGVVIINWKGHCTAYCKAEAERRKAG